MPVQHPETITVDTEKFYCDGSGKQASAALGHPRVFLTINAQGFVDCPYCDRHFVLAAGAKAAAH
ncbi:MAG: zinc-finger domain-containing protein [Alphaproteobacteria bacterium]